MFAGGVVADVRSDVAALLPEPPQPAASDLKPKAELMSAHSSWETAMTEVWVATVVRADLRGASSAAGDVCRAAPT